MKFGNVFDCEFNSRKKLKNLTWLSLSDCLVDDRSIVWQSSDLDILQKLADG